MKGSLSDLVNYDTSPLHSPLVTAYLATVVWGISALSYMMQLGIGGLLLRLTSAPFWRRSFRTGSESGTLAEIIRGDHPMSS